MKQSNSNFISLHVYNNSPYQITLPLGLLGYCETNATNIISNEKRNIDYFTKHHILYQHLKYQNIQKNNKNF